MKALVIYDSFYGNTEKIAGEIGRALGAPPQVTVLKADQVNTDHLVQVDLLVVGSPTQKFSPLPSITRWLKSIPAGALSGLKVAVFDTRILENEINKIPILRIFVRLFGYAAEPIAARLKKNGAVLVIPPEGFYITGTEGPLLDGELERAAEWAKKIIAAQ